MGDPVGRSKRRRWLIVSSILLALTLIVGAWWWISSAGFRVSSALEDIDAVESFDLRPGERPADAQVLHVEIASSADKAEINDVLRTAQAIIMEELADSARVSLGTADVRLSSVYHVNTSDAAVILTALNSLEDGRAEYDGHSLTFIEGTTPALLSAPDWLPLIQDEDVSIQNLTAHPEEGFNTLSIDPLQPNTGQALETLNEWAPDIEQVEVLGSSMKVTTELPFYELGPLAEDAQSASKMIASEGPWAQAEGSDGRILSIVDDTSPQDTLDIAEGIDSEHWQVQRISTNLASIDITAPDDVDVDPSRLSDLADELSSAELREDATVSVDDGALFEGKNSDLQDLAPTITQFAAQGYTVGWAREDRGPGVDARVWVEMPQDQELTEDEDLEAAIDVARSLTWPGDAAITLRTNPEGMLSTEQKEVTITSTTTGTADEVVTDPDHLVSENHVREAWDATATDD